MSKYIPVDPEKWAEMVKAMAEVTRLKAEVEELRLENGAFKRTVNEASAHYDNRLAEVARLKAEVELSTTQYNSIIDQQVDVINDLKNKVEHLDLFKSVVEKFFNSADLKNPLDAQSCYALAEKLKQLPDCILDFTEEQVRDNPAWALAVFRHKVKEMQYKRVHDLNAIGGEQEENARLKAEIERLRKAGDDLGWAVHRLKERFWDADEEANKAVQAWNAAKEGKQS